MNPLRAILHQVQSGEVDVYFALLVVVAVPAVTVWTVVQIVRLLLSL